jgi:hypothetical protein
MKAQRGPEMWIFTPKIVMDEEVIYAPDQVGA